MHLLCEVWILFFNFLVSLGYDAEQVSSKWVCTKTLYSKQHKNGVKYLFYNVKTLVLH